MKFKLVEDWDRLEEEYYYRVDFNHPDEKGKLLKDFVYIISDKDYSNPPYVLRDEISNIMIKRKIPHESSDRKWKKKLKDFDPSNILNIKQVAKKDALRNQDHLLIKTSKDLRDETRINSKKDPIIPLGFDENVDYLIHHPDDNELLSKNPKESSYIIYEDEQRHVADAIHQILHVAKIDPRCSGTQKVILKDNPIRVYDKISKSYISRELELILH